MVQCILFQRSSGLGSASLTDPLKYSSTAGLGLSSPLSKREENSSSSSVQTKSYSSSSSAVDGGRPHHSSHTDSVSRTTRYEADIALQLMFYKFYFLPQERDWWHPSHLLQSQYIIL